jgi:hypothetical protein
MAFSNDLPFPTFSVGTITQTAGTAIVALIPPWRGANGVCMPYTCDARWKPNWVGPSGGAFTHLSSLVYSSTGTAHKVGVLRPLNWTVVAAAAAAAQAVINIYDDPGIYSTNYKYPTVGGVVAAPQYGGGTQGGTPPSQVADHGIAGSDYAVYQVADGTWVLDTVASVSTLAITMTTNVPTGGVLKGAPFFYFGTVSINDPGTGLAQWQTNTAVTASRAQLLNDVLAGSIQSNHPGDPMVFYSPNGSSAGALDEIAGFYARH